MKHTCSVEGCGRKFKNEHALNVHRARGHRDKTASSGDTHLATGKQNNHRAIAEELVAMNELLMGYDSLTPAARAWFKERVLS